MIRLFTTFYDEVNDARRSEYLQCIELNLECPWLDELCILAEGGEHDLPVRENLKVRRVEVRPTYLDYLRWIADVASDEDISIIANTDIFVDHHSELFAHWSPPCETVMALSRWEYADSSEPTLFDRNDSQDAWVFRGVPREIAGDYGVGIPRCDNRFLFELQKAGYKVINPAFSIRTYHLHAGERVEYRNESLENFVDPPYAYLWPHNLWSLPRTLLHNAFNPGAHVSWRVDRRKIYNTLPLRISRKVASLFQRNTH